jgi:phospholipid/cholesterol/gamma-HCH transport system ATP-binding protein
VIRESQHPWVQQFLKGLPDGPVAFHYKAPDFKSELLGDNKAGAR